jgi:hypothetical protein
VGSRYGFPRQVRTGLVGGRRRRRRPACAGCRTQSSMAIASPSSLIPDTEAGAVVLHRDRVAGPSRARQPVPVEAPWSTTSKACPPRSSPASPGNTATTAGVAPARRGGTSLYRGSGPNRTRSSSVRGCRTYLSAPRLDQGQLHGRRHPHRRGGQQRQHRQPSRHPGRHDGRAVHPLRRGYDVFGRTADPGLST